ncbi:cobalt transporter [[Haemophilus] ducreyi]|uniref:Nickel/cobalt efflux system n=2 Tax=Haemophilus ducreyi TaxID=730 RepID=Q7VL61_HAEDU|nr:nickel/cobalt transporter [[Haemophilus] ducreyi]AAP96398.1 hypothetical protein HD_1621 [[Haemophilus] ducreyi 35000HP]AKO31279.1 cobalt transporter [[Haemophilus] ducreyi]AKO32726.1 cobalt transporter [[Haemophilus] ducreyi]AKO34175.1 cobalt transporter [[Haemophilus] ducreyi]AKO35619.1 cobalt transporter [[Haemophilus] ducreyi]
MRINSKELVGISIILLLGLSIYQFYPFFLFKVVEWQKEFNQLLSSSLNALTEHKQQAGLTLIAVSFLYGVFHAVGPGHGKFILTSYLSLETTKLNQAMKLTLAAALVQGIVAVVLVSIIIVVFTLSRNYFNLTLKWIERGSFSVMIILGVYWCYQSFKLFKQQKKPLNTLKIKKIAKITKISPQVKPLTHTHSAHCGCGHQHLPSSAQIQQAKDWKAQIMIILSIGARPCSGAILVLFLAYTLDLYSWGVLSALAMAVGTGLTLSLFAWLVLVARNKAIRLSSWYISEQHGHYWAAGVKMIAACALIILGITLFHSSFIELNMGTSLLKR